jgi:hypothetical protein
MDDATPGIIAVVGTAIIFMGYYVGKSGWAHFKASVKAEEEFFSKYKLSECYKARDTLDTVLGINFDERWVVLGTYSSPQQYSFSQIASVEIDENEETISKVNRGSQVVGAAVGGLVMGPLGGLIGGLSASSRSRPRLRSISLKITVDDAMNPVYRIIFFQSPGGVDPEDPSAREAMSQAERFQAHLKNAMRQAEREQKEISAQPSIQGPPASITSELRVLWEMKQAGALTDEELSRQKQRLLSEGINPPA